MWRDLGRLMLAAPLTAYYGYTARNRVVQVGMYALALGIAGDALYGLYKANAPIKAAASKQLTEIQRTPIKNNQQIIDGELIKSVKSEA